MITIFQEKESIKKTDIKNGDEYTPKSVLEPQSTEKGYAQFSLKESESSKTRPFPQSFRVAVPFSHAQYLSHDLE